MNISIREQRKGYYTFVVDLVVDDVNIEIRGRVVDGGIFISPNPYSQKINREVATFVKGLL